MNEYVIGDVAARAIIEQTNIAGVLDLAVNLGLLPTVELLSSNERNAIVYVRVVTAEHRLAKVTATYVQRFDGIGILAGEFIDDNGAVYPFEHDGGESVFNSLSDFRDAVRVLGGQNFDQLTARGARFLSA